MEIASIYLLKWLFLFTVSNQEQILLSVLKIGPILKEKYTPLLKWATLPNVSETTPD